ALEVQPDPVQSVPGDGVPPLGARAHPPLRRDPAARRPHRHHAQDARRRHRRGVRPARRRRSRSHAAQRRGALEGGARVRRFLYALCMGLSACTSQLQEPSADTGQIVGEVGDPRNRARVHTELASVYYERGNYAVALDELRMATTADSSYPQAYSMYGLVYTE